MAGLDGVDRQPPVLLQSAALRADTGDRCRRLWNNTLSPWRDARQPRGLGGVGLILVIAHDRSHLHHRPAAASRAFDLRRHGLIGAGTAYFALIGVGSCSRRFRCCSIFGVFLGHPIYAMGVCLFSLILSSGLGSFASERLRLDIDAAHGGLGTISWPLICSRAGGVDA